MTFSFIHCGDIHLGYNQFGIEERFIDFGRAFEAVIDEALSRNVDYFLIAGDFFNRRMINAPTLSQAMDSLHRLRDAGIKTIAIEGNHDKAPYADRESWMRFLAEQDLIYLLSPSYNQGRLVLQEWSAVDKSGSILHFPGVRFVGLGYPGSMAARRLGELKEQLESSEDFTILLLHGAVDRMLHLGGVGTEAILPLRDVIDYAALGHIHERYELDGWVYNPGSLECWDLGEAGKDKGFYYVKCQGKSFEVEHLPSLHREVIKLDIDLTGTSNLESAYQECVQAAGAVLPEQADPVLVQVTLKGKVGFDPYALDSGRIAQLVSERLSVLHVEVVQKLGEQEQMVPEGGLDVEFAALEGLVLNELVESELASTEDVPAEFKGKLVALTRLVHEQALLGDEETIHEAVMVYAQELAQLLDEQSVPKLEQVHAAGGEDN